MFQHDQATEFVQQRKEFMSIREIRQICGSPPHDYSPCPTPDYASFYEGLHENGTLTLDFGVT